MIWIAGALPASSETRRIVLLYDERPDLPGLGLLQAEFVRTIAAYPNPTDTLIEVYHESMDLSRFGSNAYQALLSEFLREKYADKKIDVVVAVYSPAFDFLLNHQATVFPGAQIVFCGVDKAQLGNRILPEHAHGVLVNREFAPTLDLALSLHPGTERVVVVAGTSEFDTQLLEQAKAEWRAFEPRVAFQYLTALPFQDALFEISRLPPQSIVLFITLFQDGAGQYFVPHEAIERVSAAASVPTYGFLDQYVGRGIVGGSVYSLAAQGTEAAKLTLQVLAGGEPSTKLISNAQTTKVMFDWRQLQRWGVSERQLPAGSIVSFRPSTAWEQFWPQILAVIALVSLQGMLIALLLYEHHRRHRAEVVARNSMAELTHMNRMAAAGELSASIAHEVNQPLTGITVRAAAGLRWLSGETPNLERARESFVQIETAGHRAAEIIANIKSMFRKDTQHKSPVEMNNLIRTVLGLVSIDLQKHKIHVQADVGDQLPPVAGNKVQLQQVILNLIMNAIDSMRSVQPRVLYVRSISEANKIKVLIEDTGVGIDPSDLDKIFKPLFTTKEHGMGLGLSICHSIIENHDGRIWASARALKGTSFQIELPIIVH